MEKLSQEIVDHITGYTLPIYLKHLLTVSKPFQYSVERIKLAQFTLDKDNTEKFLQLYTGYRISYLREVIFVSSFPKWKLSDSFDGCREKTGDLLVKNELFTHQIGVLFQTLKSLEDRTGAEKIAGKLRLTIFPPKRAVETNQGYCRHRVCVCWRVHLLNPEKLPRLFSIHTLNFKDWYFDARAEDLEKPSNQPPSKLDLRIMLDIASKLPKLERLKWNVDIYWKQMNSSESIARHFFQDWAGPHRDTRHDFARALHSIKLPSCLKQLDISLHLWRHEYQDQRGVLPNLVLPGHYDPFSNSLRVISCHLQAMNLRVMADQTLFWPIDGQAPHWPHLRYLDVWLLPTSPSGLWYFQGPRGEGSDTAPGYEITEAHYEPMEANSTDEAYDNMNVLSTYQCYYAKQFRIVPIERTFRPVLVSFAKAAACMPSLRKAVLGVLLEFRPYDIYDYYDDLLAEIRAPSATDDRNGYLGWGIAYAKPGENIPMRGMGHTSCASRQFWWMTQEWRPDETLHALIHKVGEHEHGNQAIDHWASDHGHKWNCVSEFPRVAETL